MIYKGYFPLHMMAPQNPSYKVSHPRHEYIGSMSQDDYLAELKSDVQALIDRNSTNYTVSNTTLTHFGPFQIQSSGTPIPNPPTKFITGPSIRTSNSPFRKRAKAGDIVVSDYMRTMAEVQYQNGMDVLFRGNTRIHSKEPPFEYEFVNSAKCIRRGGYDILNQGVNILSEYREVELGKTPYQLGWNDNYVEFLMSELRAGSNEEYDLILQCAANANRGTLDLLTAFAEAPETVKSIYQGCKTAIRMYGEAKQKEFRLRNKIKRIKDRNVHNVMQAERDTKEILDAISDVWLNFRYNIMPTVLTIEDILKTLDESGSTFHRWREGSTLSRKGIVDPPDGWSVNTTDLEYTFRCFIKRKIKGQSHDFWSLSSTNLLVTAWELVPASFIFDWFIKVGDLLASLGTPNYSFEEGATLSRRLDQTIVFTHDASKAKVIVTLRGYYRFVINPTDFCRFVYDGDLAGNRTLDTLALAWKVFLTKHLTH